MAILTRRTLTVTSAPSFKSLSRMVPAVAFASSVPCNAMRRKAVIDFGFQGFQALLHGLQIVTLPDAANALRGKS